MELGAARSPLPQLRRGVLENCVLSLLDGEPLYGFDLVRRLAADEVLISSQGRSTRCRPGCDGTAG
jgi:PadR family transcriptional regulator PadR